jgi:hypothetical protein
VGRTEILAVGQLAPVRDGFILEGAIAGAHSVISRIKVLLTNSRLRFHAEDLPKQNPHPQGFALGRQAA